MKIESARRQGDELCLTTKDPEAVRWLYSFKPGLPEAHYIPRSRGGLGIEENVLTLCRACHDRFDHGTRFEREGMRQFFREYLMSQYPDWKENDLTYRKEKL